MKFYLRPDGYLQVWDDKHTKCISLGSANILVRKILDENQTKKMRVKLTKIIEECNENITKK